MRKITILLCFMFIAFNSCEKENMTQKNEPRAEIIDLVLKSEYGKLGGGYITVVIESGHKIKPDAYLSYNCEEPVHFQIDSQEPCEILNVDSETGRLSLLSGGGDYGGLCGNYDEELRVHYSVTDVSGEIESYFFVLTAEDFIILNLEDD